MINKKIIILGAYGQENIGDEALLEVIVKNLKSLKNVEISVNSSNPLKTRKCYGINSFHTSIKKDFWKKINKFLNADFIIYGGGTLLVELRKVNFNKKSPLYRAFIINIFSKILRKKVIYYGVGAEKVRDKISTNLIKSIVNLSNLCFLRDKHSYDVLKEYGAKNDIKIGADPCFLYKPEFNLNKKNLNKNICVLPLYRILEFDNYFQSYIQNLSDYAIKMSNEGYKIEFCAMSLFPSDKINDEKIINLIKIRIGENKNINYNIKIRSPKEFLKYLKKFDLVLSSRFHGLVFSVLNEIPIISLSNFEKNESLMNDYSLNEYSLNSSEVKSEKMVKLTHDIIEKKSIIIEKIRGSNKIFSKKANEMMNVINKYIISK